MIEIYANYGVSNKIQISKFQPSKSWKSMKKLLTILENSKSTTVLLRRKSVLYIELVFCLIREQIDDWRSASAG